MIMQEKNSIAFLLERFDEYKNEEAIVWNIR
jgi:hypothetical protein